VSTTTRTNRAKMTARMERRQAEREFWNWAIQAATKRTRSRPIHVISTVIHEDDLAVAIREAKGK